MTAGRAARRIAILLAFAFTACGGPEPPYAWTSGDLSQLDVTVREELLPTKAARAVRFSAKGAAPAEHALDLEIFVVRHERWSGGELTSVVDTETVAAPPDRSREEAALAAVSERLLGRRIRLAFDGDDGLAAIEGLDAALAAAGPPSDAPAAEAVAGLAGLIGDVPLRGALRASGLVAPPARFRDVSERIERRAEVRVPGVGLVPLQLLGIAGFEKDGSGVVRWDGVAVAGTPSLATDAPEGEVGRALLGKLTAVGETLCDPATRRPLRGNVKVRVPYGGGATVVTATSFTWTVRRP